MMLIMWIKARYKNVKKCIIMMNYLETSIYLMVKSIIVEKI